MISVFSVMLLIVMGICGMSNADAAWLVKEILDGKQSEIISVKKIGVVIERQRQIKRSTPLYIAEYEPLSKEVYQETLYRNDSLPAHLLKFARAQSFFEAWPDAELRILVNQGPPKNRIDLTIVGDGYTLSQKERFFSDAKRMTDDLFSETTFNSYLPLFNVYAVFVPSNESGITDLVQKDTVFGLYRMPAGSKRGIFPRNSSAIERALDLAPDTDYPIVIANDDFYGGLGGRFAITTRSLESGSMVLRHELGHNFGEVGEEYDGGSAYFGANHSSTSQVDWRRWADESFGVFEAKVLAGDYLWKNLTTGSVTERFDFPGPWAGGPASFSAEISSVGWSTPEDVHIVLDGNRVTYRGLFTQDRSFFTLDGHQTLSRGSHTLSIGENISDGDNVLAFYRLYAYPATYNFTPGLIGAFATFNSLKRLIGFRPTHNDCLMRNMRTFNFCPIDVENMWLKFLNQLSLIDKLTQSGRQIQVHVPQLEGLTVQWFILGFDNSERELLALHNQRSWDATDAAHGRYKVRVTFETPEIRKTASVLSDDTRFNLD